jgi:glycosyltransferase
MPISIITAVRNRAKIIEDAVLSIRMQSYPGIEHIVIDGKSDDGTLDILTSLTDSGSRYVIVSEPDNGVYDAINKGIRMCTSDVIGLLHSDDVFAGPETIELVMKHFEERPELDVVYGDLIIFDEALNKPIRFWQAGNFAISSLKRGWMPPHPTLFVRRRVFEQFGQYDTSYRVSADYDFILRIFKSGDLIGKYIPQVLVYMRGGGLSSKKYSHIMKEDYRAIKKNGVGGVGTLLSKYARSASQYLRKRGHANQIKVG